ncbi:hypothetical protein E3Y23_004203 [Escherichia coli]|nr:hypothetical protein [Escherichia coli]
MKNPPRISPTFSRISRSAPPLMTLSKILTDIFHTANNLTYCKTTNQLCAGDASIALASAILSCDRYSIFEQDYPCSGLIRQAVRHTGDSVQISLVTTFTCSVPLSGALSFISPWTKMHYRKKCPKIFLVIGIFVVGRTSASGHNCWHVQKNRCGD